MIEEKLSTKEKLARALEAEMTKHPSYKPIIIEMFEVVIKRARSGAYDDLESPLATPQLELINSIRTLNVMTKGKLQDFLNRVMSGEFEASDEEWEAWKKTPEGKAAERELKRLDLI